MNDITVTVKQLNMYIKSLIESDGRLAFISVSGEISNFKNHYSSGHWYFTLKDSDAQIRCVMFKSANCRVNIPVQDGMQAVIKGRVSVYERDGQYQIYAEEIHPYGKGDLSEAFNILKEKLQKEGLFSAEHKRQLKRFPSKIAVLTSDTGAAVKDILNITAKRYPICKILLCPVMVQGENAVKSMTDMLGRVYSRDDIDTIIIGRGGGSIEDLWAFNSEILARKIFDSPIPVISAVGHETDFTICDFVADVRASTPSHAAELAVPDISEISDYIFTYTKRISNLLYLKYTNADLRYKAVMAKSVFSAPEKFIDNLSLKIDNLEENMTHSLKSAFLTFEKKFSDFSARIDAMSPLKVISRGYAAVSANGKSVKCIKDLSAGQKLNLKFADGTADCEVIGLKGDKE